MPPPTPPDVRRLLDDRDAARASKDWARADALRDELAGMGWEVQDGPEGSTVRPILPADRTEPRLSEPATVAASVQVVAEDHPDDLARLLRGLFAHSRPSPGNS